MQEKGQLGRRLQHEIWTLQNQEAYTHLFHQSHTHEDDTEDTCTHWIFYCAWRSPNPRSGIWEKPIWFSKIQLGISKGTFWTRLLKDKVPLESRIYSSISGGDSWIKNIHLLTSSHANFISLCVHINNTNLWKACRPSSTSAFYEKESLPCRQKKKRRNETHGTSWSWKMSCVGKYEWHTIVLSHWKEDKTCKEILNDSSCSPHKALASDSTIKSEFSCKSTGKLLLQKLKAWRMLGRLLR